MPIYKQAELSLSQVDTYIVPPNKLAWYRPDIDGLRAIAVLSVVLFHAFPGHFPGGFVGVDVFFVVSGFLISGIIFRGLDKNTFSFASFYSKRVRRIFPSLALVLVATFGLGWTILLNSEFRHLASHIIAGVCFYSNVELWGESGYFDKAAEMKPLLHLWSLGIEEQFYLLFPAIFFFAHRRHWNRRRVVVACLAVSFILNAVFYVKHPIATFYNPATRFWELLLGSFLALMTDKFPQGIGANRRHLPTLVSIAGLCLLAAGFSFATNDTPFPGWFALLPTVGSFLMIGAGMTSLLNLRILSNRVMRWFGNISYPLYLWHWPLLVYARIVGSGPPTVSFRIAIVTASILLSWLTCILLENPLRFGGGNRGKVAALVTVMIALGLVGRRTIKNGGYTNREVNRINSPDAFVLKETIENTAWGCGIEPEAESKKFNRCQHDTREKPTIALLGDSKARALSYGLFKNSHAGSRVLFIGDSSAFSAPLPIISDLPLYAKYQPMIRLAADAIIRNPDIKVVIITAATRALYQLKNVRDIGDLAASPNQPAVVEGLDKVVSLFVEAGKKVILTVDNPTLPPPPDCIDRQASLTVLNTLLHVKPRNCSISYEKHMTLSRKYRAALAEVAGRHPDQVRIFDTLPLLVDATGKTFNSVQDGHLNYSISDHVSDYAADKIGQKLIPFAEEFTRSKL